MPRIPTFIHIKAILGLVGPDSMRWFHKVQKRVLKTGRFSRWATLGLGNRYVSSLARSKPAQRIVLPRKCPSSWETASSTVSRGSER